MIAFDESNQIASNQIKYQNKVNGLERFTIREHVKETSTTEAKRESESKATTTKKSSECDKSVWIALNE